MLARQQADSSEGGFAKLARFSFLFSFFSFHFFLYFLIFLLLHMGSQGWFGHCYGLGFLVWDLVQG